jgi:hypothetical protein
MFEYRVSTHFSADTNILVRSTSLGNVSQKKNFTERNLVVLTLAVAVVSPKVLICYPI